MIIKWNVLILNKLTGNQTREFESNKFQIVLQINRILMI